MEVVVEILWISNKIKSGTDLRRHSKLPTPNSQLPDKFQFARVAGLHSGSCGALWGHVIIHTAWVMDHCVKICENRGKI